MGTLKVNKLTGITGVTGQEPITLSGDTATLGSGVTITSGVTFPTCPIIGYKIMYGDLRAASTVSTGNPTFTNSGLEGTYTPIKSSSDSMLLVKFMCSKSYFSNPAGIGEITCCVTTSSDASYADANSIGNPNANDNFYRRTANDNNYFVPWGVWWFKEAGSIATGEASTPSNLTSYASGTEYRFRIFYKNSSDSGTWYFVHQDSKVLFDIWEIVI